MLTFAAVLRNNMAFVASVACPTQDTFITVTLPRVPIAQGINWSSYVTRTPNACSSFLRRITVITVWTADGKANITHISNSDELLPTYTYGIRLHMFYLFLMRQGKTKMVWKAFTVVVGDHVFATLVDKDTACLQREIFCFICLLNHGIMWQMNFLILRHLFETETS